VGHTIWDTILYAVLTTLFLLYIHSAYPLTAPRDSAEYASTVPTLSIPHQPGYPLYTITANIFQLLHLATPSFCVTVFSSICTVLTCFLLYRTMLILNILPILRILAVILYGFNPLIYLQSTIAGPFMLNALFLSVFIYLTINTLVRNNAYIASYLFGLSLCNHQTILLILPLVYYLLKKKKVHTGSTLFFFLCGLTPYLFLIVRSAAQPVVDTGDTESLSNLFSALFRTDFGTLRLHHESYGNTSSIAARFHTTLCHIRDWTQKTGWLTIIFSIPGMIKFSRRIPSLWKYIFASILFSGPGLIILASMPITSESTEIMQRFYVLPFTLMIIPAITGMDWILRAKNTLVQSLTILFFAILCFNCFVHIQHCFQFYNNRHNYVTPDFMHNIFITIEPNNLLFLDADNPIFLSRYCQLITKKRVDTTVIENIPFPWYIELMKKRYPTLCFSAVKLNSLTPSVFFENIVDDNIGNYQFYTNTSLGSKYDNYLTPSGLLLRLQPSGRLMMYTSGVYSSVIMSNLYVYRSPPGIGWYTQYFDREIIGDYVIAWENVQLSTKY